MKSDYWQRMLFPDGNGRIEEKVKKPDITRRRHKGEPFSEAANPSPESKSRDRLTCPDPPSAPE
jgi:hypothetical protein